MKSIYTILSFLIVFLTCINPYNCVSQNEFKEIPKVKADQTYEVQIEKDIVYALALSHERINSPEAKPISLKLDIYSPVNNVENRPVYMFIHGGGFVGGTKQQSAIIDQAHYYASRGWVFVAIDYRLRDDKGTVPEEWIEYSTKIPKAKVNQFLAMYPAQRDAKAALRWIVANAKKYKINPKYITVGGGSAGAITAITAGISNQEDFRDEIDLQLDPTLASTNMEQKYLIKAIINYWGSKIALDNFEKIFGHQRFDNNNPPLFIAHGTLDPIVLFDDAKDLKTIYKNNNVPFAFYPLKGKKHGAWKAKVNNKTLEELAFDFITTQQNLIVE